MKPQTAYIIAAAMSYHGLNVPASEQSSIPPKPRRKKRKGWQKKGKK